MRFPIFAIYDTAFRDGDTELPLTSAVSYNEVAGP